MPHSRIMKSIALCLPPSLLFLWKITTTTIKLLIGHPESLHSMAPQFVCCTDIGDSFVTSLDTLSMMEQVQSFDTRLYVYILQMNPYNRTIVDIIIIISCC